MLGRWSRSSTGLDIGLVPFPVHSRIGFIILPIDKYILLVYNIIKNKDKLKRRIKCYTQRLRLLNR